MADFTVTFYTENGEKVTVFKGDYYDARKRVDAVVLLGGYALFEDGEEQEELSGKAYFDVIQEVCAKAEEDGTDPATAFRELYGEEDEDEHSNDMSDA